MLRIVLFRSLQSLNRTGNENQIYQYHFEVSLDNEVLSSIFNNLMSCNLDWEGIKEIDSPFLFFSLLEV